MIGLILFRPSKASPAGAAKIAGSLSDWPNNTTPYYKGVQDKLKSFVSTGQLGIFTNGYWGHPAMKLPPEVNLIAAAHYLEALEYQREINKIVSILGSKTPHIQNLAVGGVANPINPDNQSALNMERLYYIKTLMDKIQQFILDVYVTDVAAVAAHYTDWLNYGAGVKNYLCVPDFPVDTKGKEFLNPGGYIPNGDVNQFKAIKSFDDDFFKKNVQESIKHSWYKGSWTHHPWEEETVPDYTDFQDNGKYSWVKAPSFSGKPAQVGPLANVLAMYVSGHEPTKKYLNVALVKSRVLRAAPYRWRASFNPRPPCCTGRSLCGSL